MKKSPIVRLLAAALSICIAPMVAMAQNSDQGVSSGQILLGSILDLSGPLAQFGKDFRNGMQMRIAEINEGGGIEGRQIELRVEDSGYDPKRAVLAARKLVTQDKVFAVLGTTGSTTAIASMPVLTDRNVISFFPVSGAREMFEEPDRRLKFAFFAPNFELMKYHVPRLFKAKGAKKACTLYQDDDYGLENFRGAEAGLKSIGVDFSEVTTYKRGATDFSSQVARLKAAQCDFIVLGTVVRETIGAMGEARKTGLDATFITAAGAYVDVMHKLGGATVEGLYAPMTAQIPYADTSSKPLQDWAARYKARFGEEPGLHSTYGYMTMAVFQRGAAKAGKALTTESFIHGMETMGPVASDLFGNPVFNFTPTQRLGSSASRLSRITDGRWQLVADYSSN